MHHGATAADSTGCVTITLDTTGRVDEIRLSARWRDKLGSDQLSAALAEAAVQAAALHAADAPPAQPPSSVSEPPEPPEPGNGAHWQVAFRCRQILIDAAGRMERDRVARAGSYTGSDSRRHATVSLSLDLLPISVELDDVWLDAVSVERLVAALCEAFHSAHAAVAAARREVEGCRSPTVAQPPNQGWNS